MHVANNKPLNNKEDWAAVCWKNERFCILFRAATIFFFIISELLWLINSLFKTRTNSKYLVRLIKYLENVLKDSLIISFSSEWVSEVSVLFNYNSFRAKFKGETWILLYEAMWWHDARPLLLLLYYDYNDLPKEDPTPCRVMVEMSAPWCLVVVMDLLDHYKRSGFQRRMTLTDKKKKIKNQTFEKRSIIFYHLIHVFKEHFNQGVFFKPVLDQHQTLNYTPASIQTNNLRMIFHIGSGQEVKIAF